MCLSTVDKKPTRKYGIGYKSVRKKRDGTYVNYDHIPNAGTVQYPLNEWVSDPQDKMIGCVYNLYQCGFHVMLTKKPFMNSTCNKPTKQLPLIRVRFRKVVATSCEDGVYGPQVVAREVMNLGEVS